jgi:branched-chain amino acid transport system permease protein
MAVDVRAKLRNFEIIEPVARRWRKLPKGFQLVLVVAGVCFLWVLPTLTIPLLDTPNSAFSSVMFYPVGIYVLVAIGLNIVVGEAGLLDLGYVAFFAIGAYTMAILGTDIGDGFWRLMPFDVPVDSRFWVILPIGIAMSMFAGLILGTPTLRLRGDYLAIVTLGFGEIIRLTARNTDAIGGPRGISNIPHPSFPGVKFGILNPTPYYRLLLIFIILVVLMVRRLERSRVGRAWTAIREDEDAAELMGVPVFKYKLWSFAMGAGIGGLAGVIYASKANAITPDNFPLVLSILFLAAVVLGGSGNMYGAALGAAVVAYLPERFRSFGDRRVLIFGVAMVVMMNFRPEGLLPSRRRAAELHDTRPEDELDAAESEVAEAENA